MPKRPRQSKTAPTLSELLTARSAGTLSNALWSEADCALAEANYASAARAYEAAASSDLSERAKLGFCLGMQGDDDGAETLLSEKNVGTHPEALALLAWVLGGNLGRRMQGRFGTAETRQRADARRKRVDVLFAEALSPSRPPSFAFNALFHVLGTHNETFEPQAARARSLYPQWAWPHAIIASKQRMAGQLDLSILEDLMRTLPDARNEDVFHEAYAHAMKLERWGDAERVIEALEKLVDKDRQGNDQNLASLAEMRAMLSLHKARTGETDAYEMVLDQIAAFVPDVPHVADGRDPTVAPKFLLQVALETGQGERLRDAATALIARAWDVHGQGSRDLDSWGPYVATPSLHGVLHFGHFGFDFTQRWREIDMHLGGDVRDRWRLLVASDAVLNRDPEPEQVQLLCATRPSGLPWWIGRAIYEANANHAENLAGAGAVLAELAERAGDISPTENDRIPSLLESLYVDIESLEDPVALFTGALEWLRMTPTATGQELLKQWGEDLAGVAGGKPVLVHLAETSLSRVNSAIAHAMKALGEGPTTPEERLAVALARYPQPESTRVRVEDLSLLEAATLVAMLRACPLDHIRWTLAALDSSGQRFEPTNKFIGTLFTLMDKGVLAIDASTPPGMVKIGDDGQLTAYLSHVVWRISSHTLALQRAIRDLPIHQWPVAWYDHAPVLSRDLGVEEMVAYLDHLVSDRGLPTPNMDDVRSLFRTQLEHLSIAQCYYLAHKTMRETLDYQARHRPGRAQIEARIVNLLRGNGERAIAQGWDTRYNRVRELPPSFLWEALHDVLTRWGNSAFDKPVMTLRLDDLESSPT